VNRFGDYRAQNSATGESDDDGDELNKKDNEIAHAACNKRRKTTDCGLNYQFATHRCVRERW